MRAFACAVLAVAGLAASVVACGGDDAGADVAQSSGGLSRWSARLGGQQGDVGFAVTGDASGNVIAVGAFAGTADLGGVAMTSAGGLDVFVAKYSPDGKPQWIRRFGGAADDMATSVAVGDSGSVYVAGASAGAIDFGAGPLGAGAAAGTFLAKLDAFGNLVFAKAFGGASYGTLVGVAVGADGSIALAGSYAAPIDLGAGPLPAPQGGLDAYVARLAGDAQPAFVKHLGGSGADLAQGVAIGAGGRVAVVGRFAGTGDFGAGPVASAGGNDVFVSTFGADGSLAWFKHVGGAGDDDGRAIAFDPKGGVVFCGGFSASVDFGAGPAKSNGAVDAFVVATEPSGSLAWTSTFGGAGSDAAVSIALDSTGGAVVGGVFEQSMMVGPTPFVSAGDRDVFAITLDAAGKHVWSKHFGSAEADEGVGVGRDGYGHALVTGYFRTQVDFGTGVLASAGEGDVFVAAYDP